MGGSGITRSCTAISRCGRTCSFGPPSTTCRPRCGVPAWTKGCAARGWPIERTSRCARSRGAWCSARRSPARCCTSRGCCSWTSPSRVSTSRRWPSSAACSRSSPARGGSWCSRRTTWTRASSSPPTSRFSSGAGSCPWGRAAPARPARWSRSTGGRWPVGETLRHAWTLARKDLVLEFRTRTAILSAVVFTALVLMVFNFGRDPTAVAAIDLAPSILWVTFTFAAMLALNRAFQLELENQALEGLLVAPISRTSIYWGKLAANLVFVAVVEGVGLPLFVLFFNVPVAEVLGPLVGVIAPAAVGLVLLGGVSVRAVVFTPVERLRGRAQKIFSLHVPAAVWTELAMVLVGVASVVFLFLKAPRLDRFAEASAEVGTVFAAIVLTTGPIWGKTVWGTWWAWDARLTSTLFLFFLYIGYLLLRGAVGDAGARARYAAVLGICGMALVPFIHLSVYLFRTLHPQPIILKPSAPSLPPSMLVTWLLSFAVFTVLYVGFVMQRYALGRAREEGDDG